MKNLIVIAMATLAFVGCGKGKDKNPLSNARVAAEDKDLQNTFESKCSTDLAKGLGTALATALTGGATATVASDRVQFQFSGDNVTRKQLYFSDINCANQIFIVEERGSFTIDKDKKTNDGGYNVDMHFKKVVAQALNPDGVTVANALKRCKIENWNQDERDVTDDSADLNCYGVKEPRDFYNVYRVDAGNLTLGADDLSVNTAEKRPAKLSSPVYSKK